MKKMVFRLCIILFFSLAFSRAPLFAQIVHPTRNIPVLDFSTPSNADYYVIFLTGNGGFRNLAHSVTHYLNSKKVSVLAINTKLYLWTEKKPAQIGCDLAFLIDRYNKKWGKEKVVIVGYSMGAEVLPFAINCLEDKYRNEIADLVYIAPWQKATFKVNLRDYYSEVNKGADIYTELLKMTTKKGYVICDDNAFSICHNNLEGVIDHDFLAGGHHFGGHYLTLSNLIGKRLNLE